MSEKDGIPAAVKNDPAQTVPPTPILLQQEPEQELLLPQGTVKHLKNIAYAKPVDLAGQVDYAQGQVTSKTLVQNPAVGVTLFAMAKGEGISAHKSTGDAFVTALEGRGQVTIDDATFVLEQGQCIVMPAGHPHAVSALDDFKMLLVVVFPEKKN
ncbi:cupin domain-containing protein [Desulfovibrio sp.]|uniref:cupin domain-containing protein n=1 Tax=Desulfovibrio sp. TaxID=885 RepID=UPI0025BC9FDD|nr:cupin domain-containing protein [Desulfovibrio sp.]